MNRFFLTLALLCLSQSAFAKDFNLKVVDGKGMPVANVAIILEGGTVAEKSGTKYAAVTAPEGLSYVMSQQDMKFDPFVLIVPKDTPVLFPNYDRIRHQVYSFSKGNRFQLQLYGRDETRSMAFKNTGVVALGCNIHDSMIAFIFVTSSDTFTKTDETGTARLPLIAGATTVTIWHPHLKKKSLQLPLSQFDPDKENVFTLDVAYQEPL